MYIPESNRVEQEVRVNLTITFSANSQLSKRQIKTALKRYLKNLVVNSDLEVTDTEIHNVKEEAEIYNPNDV